MPAAFSQSLRSLAAERFSHALVGWLPAVALLGGWIAWFMGKSGGRLEWH